MKISKNMIAICGMNCAVCYKHLIIKKYAKQCNGCNYNNETLPKHCRKCKIKDCAKSKKVKYCFECKEYACKWIKNLDKTYKQKYQISLIQKALSIKESGIEKFLEREKEKWTCSTCGGVISLHDRICSNCMKSID